ncbi:hypothetical protein P389DRAFT_211202 [Cystobasidium minutum MCA 4210]|uniref:uncharacterized protein n=1 Tax=Cystobasidium minutum MCA 4210 TaxID=1397322 RepID=UPI0034CFB6A6|eukprot:jgi/Rhomi1/211202/estExt_Genemark1.C_4_t20348
MAGPNLELFKFVVYVSVPIAFMAYFGDPEWYNKHVYPLKDAFVKPEKAEVTISETPNELKQQIAQLRAQRLAKKEQREAQQQQQQQ